MGINSDKKTGFISTAKAGIVSAIVAVGAGVSAPAASSQQLEMDLLDMVGMGGITVNGFVSLTNTVFWRGISLTPKNGFGVNAAIHAGLGDGGYLGMFGTNYGLGDTDGVLIVYGGYANSIGDTGLGYNIGSSYLYHFGSYDNPFDVLDSSGAIVGSVKAGDRTRDSETRSIFELHLAGSYTEPFFKSIFNLRADFDYYHNGSNVVTANDPTVPLENPYWAIHISGGQSWTPSKLPDLTIGWAAGGYVTPLLDPDLKDLLTWAYGSVFVNYNIGKGIGIGLRGFWNDIAVADIPNLASGSGGEWSFTLTKSF